MKKEKWKGSVDLFKKQLKIKLRYVEMRIVNVNLEVRASSFTSFDLSGCNLQKKKIDSH
jgi:hypothetical protein